MSDLPSDDLGGFRRIAPPQQSAPAVVDMGGFTRSTTAKPGLAEQLWSSGLKTAWQMATAGPRLVQGVAEGVFGEGIPAGRASELEGGPGRFAGRAIGTGARSLAESLWEGLIKPPGKMLTGEMQPGPEAEAAARGMGLAMAGMGWRPGMTPQPRPLSPEAPPSPPMLMLPPPTVQVAGQPATSTGQLGVTSPWRSELEAGGRTLSEAPPTATGGVGYPTPWRESLEAGGRRLIEEPPMPVLTERLGLGGEPRVLPPGQQPGMLPPGPGSTMTHPAASPPPTSPRAPAEPAPPPTRLKLAPLAPAAPRDPRVDAATINLYRRSVLPRVGGRRDIGQVEGYEQNVLRGVDKLVENRPNLTLKTPQGMELPAGTAPRTMRQFDDAIDQTKTALFEKWNPMAARAGEEGLRIDLAPVGAELRALAQKPEIYLSNPGAVQQLENFAALYERQGLVSPLEAQSTIKNINVRLASFYEKGEAASGAPAMVLDPVARLLRKQLDEGIERTVGPGWQELRRDYGALSAIERDVTKAVERIAKQAPTTGIGKLANFVSTIESIRAIATLSPDAMVSAFGAKVAGELHRFYSNPNRMVARLFDKRIAGPPGQWGQSFDPFLGPAALSGAIGAGDLMSQRRPPEPGSLGMNYRLSQPSGVGVPVSQTQDYSQPPRTSINGP